MDVKVEVELILSPTEVDTQDMFASAKYLTNNAKSIAVYVPDDKPQSIVAEFTIEKARQGDVVDKIGRRFRNHVENYSQSSISFPKATARKIQQPRNQYTRKQGQYLAFIYYYTKLVTVHLSQNLERARLRFGLIALTNINRFKFIEGFAPHGQTAS